MALANGTRLGPYEITAALGAGGMGEVYRARDTRLDRTVAIKILPGEFASDAKLKTRFEREAKTISALSHPNICALHDVGPDYLVMEYCQGKTLAQRIASSPLPIDKVIEYGIQIAGALDKAHRAGIIHRDLKPSNVIVTKTGVKLLDFGLAKQSVDSSPEQSTVQQVTEEGKLLGTVQYMAPELFAGKEADARSDIFALGLVLYEMATGKAAFVGTSKATLIAAILEHQPPHVDGPAPLDRLIRHCLDKDPERRMQSAHDVLLQLESLGEPEQRQPKRRTSYVWSTIALVLFGISTVATWKALRPNAQAVRPGRFQLQPPAGVHVAESGWQRTLALSPDGERVAFQGVSSEPARSGLYLRSTRELEARLVVANASEPFFSPDSKWLAFFAGGALQKIEIDGGQPRRICAASRIRGATWGEDGTIVFSTGDRLLRVSADGGQPNVVTVARGSELHLWPQFLPGCRHALFTRMRGSSEAARRIAVVSLDDGQIRELVPGTYPRYARDRIIYSYLGTLFSLPYDFERFRITGVPTRVLDDVYFYGANGFTAFDLSEDGSLVYMPGAWRLHDAEVVWIDREGHVTQALPDRRPYDVAVASPDGKRVAAVISRTLEDEDLWSFELSRGTWTRLTSGMNVDAPTWFPDGNSLLFISFSSDKPGLFRVSANGTGAPKQLTSGDELTSSVSPDGATVVFGRLIAPENMDVMTLSMTAGSEPQPFVATPGVEMSPMFSPDGRWIAYESAETGNREIHVRPFPAREPRVTISTDGGSRPFWSGDGHELFYRSRNAKEIWSASISVTDTLHATRPKRVFAADWLGATPWTDILQASADGTKFLTVLHPPEENPERRLVYAPRWIAELK